MDRLFPELRRFPEAGQRREAMGRALSAAASRPSYIVAIIAIFGFSASLILASYLGSLSPDARDVIAGWCMFGVPISMAVLLLLCRRTIRRSIRRDLNATGLPTCLRCGYDLSGSRGGRCPECGVPSPSR